MLTEKDLSMLPIIIADVDVESSLLAMCKQAEILLNCVGPVWAKCFNPIILLITSYYLLLCAAYFFVV